MVEAFTSNPEDLYFRPEGWEILPSGVLVTRLPVWDARHDIAARLGFGPAADWLQSIGFRLPTVADMDALHSASLFVKPFTMPRKWQLQEDSVPRTAEDINRYRTQRMMGLDWCKLHDAAVWHRLSEAGWDGEPVANFGKHWVEPVGTIYGWWKADGTRWQNPSTFHRNEPEYVDYATNFHAACTAEAIDEPSP